MAEGESPEFDERCPECGRKRRHRRHAPSMPGPSVPRWVVMCLGIIVGAFGALVSSSIGAGTAADEEPTTVVASTEARDTGPTVANPANSDPVAALVSSTSAVPPTLASVTTTSTTTTVSTTPPSPPTTPPGANVADTVTTTSTSTTTTLAPATAATILPAVPATGDPP